MNIVITDIFPASTGDISLSGIEALGRTFVYTGTTADQLIDRAIDADILVINKVVINREVLEKIPRLKCICLLATGYDNVDIAACKDHDVAVYNARDYSSESVAQHVFASILHVYNQIGVHDASVKRGEWDKNWCYYLEPIEDLSEKTIGIVGYGNIGRRVADIAQAFGMNILAYRRHPTDEPGVSFVDIDRLFDQADIVSLHLPLNSGTREIINHRLLERMKSSSILINTGRGGLVVEQDLYKVLAHKKIRAAVLDVLGQEPPLPDNLLIQLENCFLTPHIAWANVRARKKLFDIVAMNIQSFTNGRPGNRVA